MLESSDRLRWPDDLSSMEILWAWLEVVVVHPITVLLAVIGDVWLRVCAEYLQGPRDIIAARGAVGEPFMTAASVSPGSSSSSESDSGQR
jgi:hypothetical protein